MDKIADCNCFQGTPYIDATGNCRCQDTFPAPPVTMPNGTVIYYPVTPMPAYPQVVPAGPAATLPAASSDGTIFGLSPLVALGIAAAALFAFSSMDGGKKNA